jgi:hypothetical protein
VPAAKKGVVRVELVCAPVGYPSRRSMGAIAGTGIRAGFFDVLRREQAQDLLGSDVELQAQLGESGPPIAALELSSVAQTSWERPEAGCRESTFVWIDRLPTSRVRERLRLRYLQTAVSGGSGRERVSVGALLKHG